MKYKSHGDDIFRKGLVGTMPTPDKPLKFDPITEIEQKEIEFCLSCTKKKCSGECVEVKEYRYNLEHGYEEG